jgi:hypothetical protein
MVIVAAVGIGTVAYFYMKGRNNNDGGGGTIPTDLVLRPTGQGIYDQLVAIPAADMVGKAKWEIVARPQIDPLACFTYNQMWDVRMRYDTYLMGNHTNESGMIQKVTLWGWCSKQLKDEVEYPVYGQFRIRVGGAEMDSTQFELPLNWTLFSTEFLQKPGGGAWSWADIDAMECGFGEMGENWSAGSIAQLYAVVSYLA